MLMAMPGLVFGQWRDDHPSEQTQEYLRTGPELGIQGFRGLLDPSRMDMSHSMSMSYVSVGDESVSRGLYMNHLKYQISSPLSLTTHLGYQFQPHGPSEWNPANTGQEFVGGADLDWRPSRNSIFRLSVYQNMMPSYYSRSAWGLAYDPYGYHGGYYPGRR
jgi:hypothetical protein